MTPEEAQKLLNGTEPGGWSLERYDYVLVLESNGETIAVEINEDEAPLIAHAPELAATVAGMAPEYAIEVDPYNCGEWERVTDWYPNPKMTHPGRALRDKERVIVRYVTKPQPHKEAT
ncbi:hypothetical protein [Corynebacterium sp. H113]|uniref:hypothetical protein n=1 Tax=Corynebacterium sp. H113 TaxID=3133419 RepID=UPI0030AE3CDE